jgi:hypothetical protein
MATIRHPPPNVKGVFSRDLRQREQDVRRTSLMMFIFALGAFIASSWLFYFLFKLLTVVAVQLENYREASYLGFLPWYCVAFAVVAALGWLAVPKPPMKLKGGGSYYLEEQTWLKGRNPVVVIVKVLVAFPNWIRMIVANYLQSFGQALDDRMVDFAVTMLTDLEMKTPVDSLLWQKHGYTKEERLYILGKLSSLGYVWLEKSGQTVYAVRSYITDEILSKAEDSWKRTQDERMRRERYGTRGIPGVD